MTPPSTPGPPTSFPESGQTAASGQGRERRSGDASDRATSQHVHLALLGLMGAGKSSVGQLVANELGRPFVDSDSLIELRSGRRPFEVANDESLTELHRREAAEANRVLTNRHAVVFAAAASIIDSIDEIDLSTTWSVWLETSPDVLAERTSSDDRDRPTLDHDRDETLARQHARRSDRGRSVADAVVETDTRSLDEVAAAVCAAWQAHVERVAARRATDEWPQGARGR